MEVPAEDHAAELAKVSEQIQALDRAYDQGSVTAETYGRMTARLEAKRDELAALPVREEWQPTGGTFHEHWASLDADGRHQLLLSFGVRAEVCRDDSPALVPDPPILAPGWREASRTVRTARMTVKVDCGRLRALRKLAARAA